MNIDEILKFKSGGETYYDILGCDPSSSVEQINREYKVKALQLHPDKNQDPSSLEAFKRIQEAKEILTDSSLRRSYDSWLNSRIHIPFHQWMARKSHTMHWVNPKSKTLSLKEESSRQGSDDMNLQDTQTPLKSTCERGSLLERFRNYEI